MLPGLQGRVGLEEGGVLAHGVEGGHQRVPLLAPLSLPDIVGRTVLVVEGIAARGAVELGHEGEEGRDPGIPQAEEHASTRDVVVGPNPIDAQDRGAGVQLSGQPDGAGEGLRARARGQGILERRAHLREPAGKLLGQRFGHQPAKCVPHNKTADAARRLLEGDQAPQAQGREGLGGHLGPGQAVGGKAQQVERLRVVQQDAEVLWRAARKARGSTAATAAEVGKEPSVVDTKARRLASERGRGRQRDLRAGWPPGRVAELGKGRCSGRREGWSGERGGRGGQFTHVGQGSSPRSPPLQAVTSWCRAGHGGQGGSGGSLV